MTKYLITGVSVIFVLASLALARQDVETGGGVSCAALNAAVKARAYDQALACAEALVKTEATNAALAEALFKAGAAAVQEKQLAAGAGFYRLLVDTFPASDQARAARAELVACYTMLRKLEACIAQARANLKLDPESEWVEYWHFLIGQSYFRLWNYKQAKTDLEAFLLKYPEGRYAKDARSCLSRIDPPWKVDANNIVSYTGKYEGDIRLQAALQAFPAEVKAGLSQLEARLGLDLKPAVHCLYSFEDAGNTAPGGVVATTLVIGRDNKPVILIRFYTEYVVAQQTKYRKTIVHELKHAGFQGLMGHPYDDLPVWVREGLALWGSEDIDDRLRMVLCNQIMAGKEPLKMLDGVEDPDRNEHDYMEDGLAFEWLASKHPENVKRFCRRLVKGESYRTIWADLSGLSYEQAMAEADAYCRRRVEAALGDGYTAFLPLRKAHDASGNQREAARKWLQEGGKRAFQEWLAAQHGHPAEPFARFCLAHLLISAGEYAPARELLQKILDEDALRCTLLDDAQLWLALSYNWERDSVNAGKAFGVLLRDFSNSNSARQVAGKFPAAGPVTRQAQPEGARP